MNVQPASPSATDVRWFSCDSDVRTTDLRTLPDELTTMVTLEEAIQILNQVAAQLATGSTSVWRIVVHARKYLELQLEAMLRESVS